jgi:hypothetical protein
VLLARAMLVRLRLAWLDLVALAGAVAALLPLVARCRPEGARRAVARAPRVVHLAERRRASPP